MRCKTTSEDLAPQAIQLRFSTTCCAVGDGLLFLGSDEGDVRVLDVGEFLSGFSIFKWSFRVFKLRKSAHFGREARTFGLLLHPWHRALPRQSISYRPPEHLPCRTRARGG